VLITGVTGFVGSHLAEYCLEKGCQVFGTGRLAKEIWRLAERSEPFRLRHGEPLAFDIQRRIADVRKAQTVLGWRPKTSPEEGLRQTIEWLQASVQAG